MGRTALSIENREPSPCRSRTSPAGKFCKASRSSRWKAVGGTALSVENREASPCRSRTSGKFLQGCETVGINMAEEAARRKMKLAETMLNVSIKDLNEKCEVLDSLAL